MSSFSFRKNMTGQLETSFKKAYAGIERDLEKKVNAAVQIVYTTARARRPKITPQMHKLMGRSKAAHRVSDPNAGFGVPVDTGDLQSSIRKDTAKRKGGKIVGRVYIEGPGADYAKYMEFGTSRIRARPFLRPAIHINMEWIKNMFKGKSNEQKS